MTATSFVWATGILAVLSIAVTIVFLLSFLNIHRKRVELLGTFHDTHRASYNRERYMLMFVYTASTILLLAAACIPLLYA